MKPLTTAQREALAMLETSVFPLWRKPARHSSGHCWRSRAGRELTARIANALIARGLAEPMSERGRDGFFYKRLVLTPAGRLLAKEILARRTHREARTGARAEGAAAQGDQKGQARHAA